MTTERLVKITEGLSPESKMEPTTVAAAAAAARPLMLTMVLTTAPLAMVRCPNAVIVMEFTNPSTMPVHTNVVTLAPLSTVTKVNDVTVVTEDPALRITGLCRYG